MARIRRQYLESKFKTLCSMMQWPEPEIPTWTREGDRNKALIGKRVLEKAWHGWRIIEIVNEGGGERTIMQTASASETESWLTGAIMVADKFTRKD